MYIDLRNTYERLYVHEAENHEENALLRRNLNTYYDEFVMRYGNLNAKHNAKFILMDASGRQHALVGARRGRQFVKADILRPSRFLFAGNIGRSGIARRSPVRLAQPVRRA